MTASLPFQQAAGIGQATHTVSEGIVAEVVNEERGIRNQSPSETSTGYEYALA